MSGGIQSGAAEEVCAARSPPERLLVEVSRPTGRRHSSSTNQNIMQGFKILCESRSKTFYSGSEHDVTLV